MNIGIDVSKATFDASWEEGGRQVHEQFAYSDKGIERFISRFNRPCHAVMEATGVYHSRLAVALHEAGFQVSVENPLKIKRFGQMKLSRVKSDKADAQLIWAYAQSQDLTVWQPSSEVITGLKQAISWHDALLKERADLDRRQEAIRYQAYPEPFVVREMKAHRKQLKERLRKSEAHLQAVVKKHFPELYARLQTIPAVGSATAIELIAMTEGFTRFDSDKALAAYVGISPTTYSSGSSIVGRGGISRTGRSRTRQLLYLCSWTARRCNPGCKAMHSRMKAAGKPPKVIGIALAHKLLRQIFAVAKSGENYRPDLT